MKVWALIPVAFRKILLWFQRAAANCLPSFAPRSVLSVTSAPGGNTEYGHKFKSKFPQVTDISTSTCGSPPCRVCWVPLVPQLGFTAELILNNTWQSHRTSGYRLFLPALIGSGLCCFCTWDMKVWNKTRFSRGGLWKKWYIVGFFSVRAVEKTENLFVWERGDLKDTFKVK